MTKTCNFGGMCKYRKHENGHVAGVALLGAIGLECHYKSFCDYSAPRDSRLAILPDGKVGRVEENCDICQQPLSKCEGHGDGH